jgi:endonuclease/exonuclease/phosphatase family metal-dependent hydrolase
MTLVRVAVWNLHGFRAGLGPVAETLRGMSPDIALLNEVRRWGRRRLRQLARDLDMEAVSGMKFIGGVSEAVLLRAPWRSMWKRVLRLPRTGFLPRRGAVAVRAESDAGGVTCASVHLGLSNEERIRHARELTAALLPLPGPLVLGGDLNEGPSWPAAAWIGERLRDAFVLAGSGDGLTYPGDEPRARIDYLFVSEGIEVLSAWVGPHGGASDHRPLLADMRVGS